MPNFCNPGDKPTIYYKFKGDSAYRKVQIGTAPIEIVIEAVQEFKSGVFIFRSSRDVLTILANSSRKRIIFKPLKARDLSDAFPSCTNLRTQQQQAITKYDSKTRTFVDVIFEVPLAQDGYSIKINTMFGDCYPVELNYEEYF